MRQIPNALAAHLEGGATTLCRCWSLTRRDGQVLGFTDHDRDLVFDGITYAATTGLEAAESAAELGFAIGGGEVAGAFAAIGLNEADLARGLYDDARVAIWLVNWADIAQRVLLETGFVGEIRRSDLAFTAEVRGLAKAFDDERGRLYMRSCSADLGDIRCGVALGTFNAVVASTDGRIGLTAPSLAGHGDGHFTGGRLIFTSGANLGFASEVKSHADAGGVGAIQLWQAPPGSIAPGDAFSLTPGCDKSFAICQAKFANGINFRGFPHIPGNDFVIGGVRPGDGALDGGSLFR
ncbi:DUF2163 domain-containing protein [Bosea caraganae]|uniref:DUF2163 domain-containing protein n=1 Tax=Bosea caraganae TaxID=2763117 RepID=A0A370L3Y5_9HYPH|nr:DUF2163 domain-containing protein [Bosea caraganae]RDJ22989.1 DUF2163 domain-containing protein [Bosea caraganae]RDJ28769.1 DUF2163 domain-containing protein [Bosea caraganae]